MQDTSRLVELNIEFLEQGKELIPEVTDSVFTACNKPVYPSGAGEHFRHIIEHYQLFLSGIGSDLLDYDARNRDTRIACDRSFACSVITDVQRGLAEIPSTDRQVRVKMAASPDADTDAPLSTSTLCRELEYLHTHTVHHYALIAMILRLQSVEPNANFGVAPSTLQHRTISASSAPLSQRA